MKLRIGTRGSALALWQADHVADRLREAVEGLETERLIFKTKGDMVLDRPLSEIGGKGLFTKELEVALLDGEIDIAVHSLKDMPTQLPEGLVLGAMPNRADVRDVLITRAGETVEQGRIIGTASLRRAALANARFPDATTQSIRGNVQTRIGRLFETGERRVDVVILAMAGMLRLGYTAREDVDFSPMNPDQWIPAVSQGALAIECRAGDTKTLEALAAIHHETTALCVTAERAFLAAVEGDCRVPVGAIATHDRGTLRLKGFIGSPDGKTALVHAAMGTDPVSLGQEVAAAVLDAGGRQVLAALRG